MTATRRLFTSESVTEGHPDKVADQISDAILDAHLALNPDARVACETLLAKNMVVIAGEVKPREPGLSYEMIARQTLLEIGYDDPEKGLDGRTCGVLLSVCEQSPDINQAVAQSGEVKEGSAEDRYSEQGAGDQGMMFGFACDETEDLMPLPIWLAHRLAHRLAEVRKAGLIPELYPDGKTQVTVEYEGERPVRVHTVVVSTHHRKGADPSGELGTKIRELVIEPVIPESLWPPEQIHINPAGPWEVGGPMADTGLTGRKVIVDTYGGAARHGGGAFSGKDPSKVDRSAAYAARWVAKHVVASGAARRCEVQVAYAIGRAEPVSVFVETFGTEKVDPARIERAITKEGIFDLRPRKIIEELGLQRPIYKKTAAYGHFGWSQKEMPWEGTPHIEELKEFLGLR
jgi:S-adenosylmethionine synthetase